MRLLHYQRNRAGKIESEVEGSGFFLHPQGRFEPDSELAADIRALFRNDEKGDSDFACRFPARSKWILLNHPFEKDPPLRVCEDYHKFKKTLTVDSVSLIFASSYINSPPSAFGHVYLKFHATNSANGTFGLTDYTVNFGARVQGLNMAEVIVFGLSGQFKGVYSIVPFDKNMKKYAYLEKREQWEYPLALSQDEIDRIIDHLWELRKTFFYYSFLTENCAYNLQTLLEVGVPELDLQTGPIITPISLLREIKLRSDLIREVRYIPSVKSQIIHSLSSMNLLEWESLRKIIASNFKIDSSTEEITADAKVLDAANLLLDYRYGTSLLSDSNLLERKLRLSGKRMTLPSYPVDPISPPPALSQDHKASTFGLGYHYRSDQPLAFILEGKPAFHTRMDFGQGAGNNFELILGDLELEVLPLSKAITIRQFKILDLFNYEPSSFVLPNLSWKVSLGLEPIPQVTGPDKSEWGMLLGIGKSVPVTMNNPFIFFTLATCGVMASTDRIGYHPFLGGLVGTIVAISQHQKFDFDGDFRYFLTRSPQLGIKIRHRTLFTPNLSFEEEVDLHRVDPYKPELKATLITNF